jgi:predicted DNA repair protein MutK
VVAWAVEALGSAVVGIAVGAVVVAVMHLVPRKKAAH